MKGRGLRPATWPCLLIVAVALSDCGGDDTETSSSSSRPRSVAAVIKGLDNPFFQTMAMGLRAGAKQSGIRLRLSAATGLQDTAGQDSALESLVGPGADCYVVNPINATNLIPSLAHIPDSTPIVNIDSPVDLQAARAAGARIRTYIGTDNVAAGRLAAKAMARFVQPGDHVALITGIPGDATSNARATGFRQGAKGRFVVSQTAAADFDLQRAALASADVLHTDPAIKGIFAVNDQMALGVSKTVDAQRRRGAVAVIGLDGIKEALDAVKAGRLSATVAQYPYAIGQLGVEACGAAMAGRTLPSKVDAPVALVEKATVARALSRFPQPFARYRDPLATQ